MADINTDIMTMAAKNKKYRMVALDLDGTLLNSNDELTDATVTHLRYLHDKGLVVAIATGRSAACAAHIVEKLDLSYDSGNQLPGFPLVCTNGARGLSIRKSHSDVGHSTTSATENNHAAPHRTNTVPLPTNPFLKQTLIIHNELFHNPLSPSLALKTLALTHKLGCVTNYYHEHDIYAVVRNEEQLELTKRYGKLTHGNTELYRYLNTDSEVNEKEEGDYNEENVYGYKKAVELGPPSKLLILCEPERVDEIINRLCIELNGSPSNNSSVETSSADGIASQQQANVVRGPFFVEVLDPSVHKGQGLHQLAHSLSIPLSEVIAFGDADNDLEFVQMAGLGVAMKNGKDVVKKCADEICEWTNDEDGVVRTLQRYEEEGKLHFPNDEEDAV